MKQLTLVFVVAAAVIAAGGCRKAGSSTTAAAASLPQAQTAAAPVKPMPPQLPEVLAHVNGEDVHKADFEVLIRTMEARTGPIPIERRDEIYRGTLDRLIAITLLLQEAKARNVTVNDADIQQRVQTLRKQFPTEEAFTKALADRGLSVERLRGDTKRDLQIQKLLESELAAVPPATDDEAKAFYDKNPDKFKQGEAVRASHILIKVDAKADEATKKKARDQIDALLKRARAGEDFAQLARENSQDGSAAQGGDLNFFTRGRMVPAFEQAAFALKPGEISDVVTTQFGYHIIKVVDHKPAGTVPLEQVSDRVKLFLREQKKQQRAEEFVASLKQKSKIEVLV